MSRLLALALAAGTILAAPATAALAAPVPARIRGTVAAIAGNTLTVHPTAGKDVAVTLTPRTGYREVLKSSLHHVVPGAYIGTAATAIGHKLVALEVVVFPPAMKGVGEGHYAWSRMPDTALAGRGTTASTMTNGTVSTAAPVGGKMVNSTMTNGTISTASQSGSAKQIVVTYKGGKQTIIVPPNVPIVTLKPGKKSDVTPGAAVFVAGTRADGKVSAIAVDVGIDGVKPPM